MKIVMSAYLSDKGSDYDESDSRYDKNDLTKILETSFFAITRQWIV